MKDLEIIILAAGKGTRMGDTKPKVLTEIKGKPMLSYPLAAIEKFHQKKPIIVLGYKAEEVKEKIGPNERYVLQTEQLGTGHAVREALALVKPGTKHVLVLYGDHPLINDETILKLYSAHINQNFSPLTLGTIIVPDYNDWREPFYGFGRILRDAEGKIIKNIEKKDASPEELKILEVSPSYFCYNFDWLKENIEKIGNKNAQGEYYLPDLVGMARDQGYKLNACTIPVHEALGVNTPEQLALVLQFIK
jgi:bifunctional UDP-N-acetylglucosamine pyrophosphorylase / glucosamine-1-phosphate N-acetyltransferase